MCLVGMNLYQKKVNMTRCYSNDQENYYREFNDVLNNMEIDGDIRVGMVYWVGDEVNPKPSNFFSVDRLIEDMQERASDECGEWAEDYLTDLPDEKIVELKTLVSNWINTNAKVSFFTVDNEKEMKLTQEDIDTYRN